MVLSDPAVVRDSIGTTILSARYYFMDDLNARQKAGIQEFLQGTLVQSLGFDRYGIRPGTAGSLSRIADLLRQMPDIRLEIMVGTSGDIQGPEAANCSRELAFFFKNMGVDVGASESTADGWVEFIFMKKEYE